METLTETVNAENARRDRARAYEVAKNEVSELRRKVERLSVAPNADTIKKLRQICNLANELPNDCIGSVGGLVPVAGEARVFIHALAASALNPILGREQSRQQELEAAKKALAAAEERLAEFEQ
jgi:hypothetical protein